MTDDPLRAALWEVVAVTSNPLPGRRRWRAKAASVLLASASVTALTGCENITPIGSTGITVDAQARPVMVFAVCKDNIMSAAISRDRTKTDPKQEDPLVSVAEWATV